jgi:hypothetical protein
MVSWLLATLLAAATQGGSPQPLISTAAGVTADKNPYPRVQIDVWLHPFPRDAWTGLGQVGFAAGVFATTYSTGNTGLQIWLTYGRPRPSFWMCFGAGLAVLTGWGHPHQPSFMDRSQVTPLASLRLGYDMWALQAVGFITSRDNGVGSQFYGVLLERLWPWF